MKRIVSFALALIMMMAALTACGGGKAVDTKAVMETVNTQFGYTDLKVLEDTDALNRYFQINPEDVKSFAAELSTTASQYTTVVLVEAVDADAAGRVKSALDAYLATQLNTAKSYDAEQVAMIEACSAKQAGNFVYLVVSDKFADIAGVIDGAIG